MSYLVAVPGHVGQAGHSLVAASALAASALSQVGHAGHGAGLTSQTTGGTSQLQVTLHTSDGGSGAGRLGHQLPTPGGLPCHVSTSAATIRKAAPAAISCTPWLNGFPCLSDMPML